MKTGVEIMIVKNYIKNIIGDGFDLKDGYGFFHILSNAKRIGAKRSKICYASC